MFIWAECICMLLSGFCLNGKGHQAPAFRSPWSCFSTFTHPLHTAARAILGNSKSDHLGRKAMTNIDSVFKSRDITLPTKVHIGKAMVFPIVMYGCESWTIKKTEHRKTDAFKLWCWRILLRVHWIARRSNHSILKEINPAYLLDRQKLKLQHQYFGHLM